jgi:diketogulonate reductase-like aldo/keto reductase
MYVLFLTTFDIDIDLSQIQTKYTPPSGQDAKNMPYDASQPIPDQIRASVASSLSHFTFPGSGEPYIDCLLLHSPLQTSQKTNLAWQALEAYVPTTIRSLGISNVTLPALQSLHERMDIKPSVVQNRFYPDTRWEVPLREFCTEKGIAFESFWTLTGNPGLMGSGVVKEVAQELARFNVSDPKPIALYALVLGLEGVSVLNGTTKEERMGNDLVSLSMFEKLIEGDWKENWERWQKEFKELIGET